MKAATSNSVGQQDEPSDYRICLSRMGSHHQSREIVSIGTTDTLEDVHQMAMRIAGKENIELRTGFPPRLLIISTEKARMVLERNERVQVVEVLAASSSAKIQDNDPEATTTHRQKRQRSVEEWACSRCTLLNASSNHACKACGAENDSNVDHDHPFSNLPQESSSTDPPPPKSPPVGSTVSLGVSIRVLPLPKLPSQITIVSFNVAGLQPSQAAPPPSSSWDPLFHFRSVILKQSPDVVCLQEVPYGACWDFLPGYTCIGSCESHCLHVVLLVKDEWAPYCNMVSNVQAPAVLGRLTFAASGVTLLLGSCHFAPFADGASARMQQMEHVLQHRKAGDSSFCIIAGDFNMRAKEDQKFEQTFGLQDAWKDTGAIYKEKNTWDSCDRTPRGAVVGTGPHNAYHGTEAFQFACRFDRIYLSGGDNLTTTSFRLFANKPLTNPFHYLSDHFGMVAKLNIKE
jgi:hypothetical protein